MSLLFSAAGKGLACNSLVTPDVENFFGLTMQDEQVAGYLGPILEEELDQWDMSAVTRNMWN
jgi:hypothetical protein